MAFKDFLRSFGKASSRLAYPSAQGINLSPTVGQSFTYAAPQDGTFFMEVSGYGDLGWINVYDTVGTGANWRSQSCPKNAVGLSSVNFQCRKGDVLTVDTGNDVYASITCRFFPSLANVGGGLSRALALLVREGGRLCLRLKTSCAAWLNLRLAKATSLTKQSSCRFRQAQHLSTPLRQTASCLSRFFQKPGRRGSTHIRWLGPDNSVLKVMSDRMLPQRRSISVFVKGSQFALTLIGLVTPRLRADSCPALETRDFSVVGG